MQDEFSKLYNKKFREISRDPSEDVWANISAALDQPSSANRQRRGWRLPFFYFSLSVLFIIIGLFFIYPNNKKENILAQQEKPKTQSLLVEQKQIDANKTGKPNDVGNTSAETKAFSTSDRNQNKLVKAETSISTNEQKVPSAPQENPYSKKNHSTEKQKEAVEILENTLVNSVPENRQNGDSSLVLSKFELPSPLPNSAVIVNEDPPLLNSNVEITPPLTGITDSVFHGNSPSSRFYFGIVGKLNNSWLLNNETYSGLQASGLNQTHFFFGPSFGIQAGYFQTPRVIFESQLLIHNQLGQTYTLFNEGLKQEKQILIRSSSMNIVAKIKLKKSNGALSGLYFIGGPQFQFITKTTETIDRGFLPEDQFRKFSPGISTGIEYLFSSMGQWQVTAGIRTDIGCRNIYAGNGIEPSNFKKTFLSDAGFYICINRFSIRK